MRTTGIAYREHNSSAHCYTLGGKTSKKRTEMLAFAPHAQSVIKYYNLEDEMIEVLRRAFTAGWKASKAYDYGDVADKEEAFKAWLKNCKEEEE